MARRQPVSQIFWRWALLSQRTVPAIPPKPPPGPSPPPQPPLRPSTKRPRQPSSTQIRPRSLPQLLPSMQRVPEMFSTSTARPRNGVSHSRWRLSLLEQVMLGPSQPRSCALAVALAHAPVRVIRPKPESSRQCAASCRPWCRRGVAPIQPGADLSARERLRICSCRPPAPEYPAFRRCPASGFQRSFRCVPTSAAWSMRP